MTQVSVGAVSRAARLWPGVCFAILLLALKVVMPLVAPQSTPLGVLAGPILAIAIAIWWAFFSRLPRVERWGGLLLAAAALILVSRVLHPSIATGMMGYMFPIYAVPIVALALVGWAVAARRLDRLPRRVALVALIFVASGAFALLRTGGFSGYIDQEFAWRWTKTPEERLIAAERSQPATSAAPNAETPVSSWPGFRGPARDGIVRGVTIATDWNASPPVEMWRRAIGPGWSSFAVQGNVIYTQEQRGDQEIVAAYDRNNGQPVWRHEDAARFWESNGGPGPRATPTIEGGRLYALGATGIVNALDARTGAVVWSHNAASDTGARIPDWGFSASPLVADDLVIVATGGVLAAYDAGSGARQWIGPTGGDAYTSPQLMTIGGVRQVVFLSGAGLAGVSLTDGKPLWQHEWSGYPIVQPAQTPDGNILFAVNESSGVRSLAVSHAAGGWSLSERWTSNRLKPWFNDFVVHKGHAYGFDGTILACIDLADGARKWKGGRYGGGQLVLLPDQDVLLIVSEEGELALVSATPGEFKELARAPGITGKTWNHPVVAGYMLLVRNGEEMAAFRLATR